MLIKHIVNNRRKRTSRRVITEKGIALNEFQNAYGHSMRDLDGKIGKPDSFISRIENGRLDFPKGESLELLLQAFGGMKPKSFFERARKLRARVQHEVYIRQWLKEADDNDVETIFELIKN